MTAPDPRAEFAGLIRSVFPAAAGVDFDALCDLLAKREAQVRAQVTEEIAAELTEWTGRQRAQAAVTWNPQTKRDLESYAVAYDTAAQLARDRRVLYCGHELHGADGGACPGCGHDPYALAKEPTDGR